MTLDIEEQARGPGIPLTTFDEVSGLDLAIDGADEVGPGLALMKCGGSAGETTLRMVGRVSRNPP